MTRVEARRRGRRAGRPSRRRRRARRGRSRRVGPWCHAGRPRPFVHVYPRDTGWSSSPRTRTHAVAVDGHDDPARRRADPAVGEDVLAARPHATTGVVLHGSVTTTLDWYGCATFRLRTAGLTIFLDAYIDRAPVAAGTGLTADDVDACDWIVIGHSHFDHVWGAERIVAQHRRPRDRELRDRAHPGARRGPDRPDDRASRGGERIELGRGVFVSRVPEPALVRVVADADDAVGRGVHRRSRRHVPGARAAHARPRRSTWRPRSTRSRWSTCSPARRATATAATAARCCSCSRRPTARCCSRTRRGTGVACSPALTPDVAILAAAGRANVDGEPMQGSLADFVAGTGRDARRRAAWCSATTTTGCPASRCPPTWRRSAPRSRRGRRDASCSSPGTSRRRRSSRACA